jgi:hypothetical protein
MYWEAKGDFSQAEAAYKAILLEQPNNEMALKRQVRLRWSYTYPGSFKSYFRHIFM